MEKQHDFSKYELDKDIPDRVWNTYMRKRYEKTYQMLTKDDGLSAIKCKFGDITPYSLIKKKVVFYGNFPTSNKKTYFYKKLPPFVKIKQDAETECICVFDEDKLKLMEKVMFIKKRKKISAETRERLIQQLKKARESRREIE